MTWPHAIRKVIQYHFKVIFSNPVHFILRIYNNCTRLLLNRIKSIQIQQDRRCDAIIVMIYVIRESSVCNRSEIFHPSIFHIEKIVNEILVLEIQDSFFIRVIIFNAQNLLIISHFALSREFRIYIGTSQPSRYCHDLIKWYLFAFTSVNILYDARKL